MPSPYNKNDQIHAMQMTAAVFGNTYTKWYRYTDSRVCGVGYDGDVEWGNSQCKIYLQELEVLKETPKGAWLNNHGTRRFVLRTAHKRFACPTKEEAKESFLARKRAHLRHLHRKVRDIEEAIAKISWIK